MCFIDSAALSKCLDAFKKFSHLVIGTWLRNCRTELIQHSYLSNEDIQCTSIIQYDIKVLTFTMKSYQLTWCINMTNKLVFTFECQTNHSLKSRNCKTNIVSTLYLRIILSTVHMNISGDESISNLLMCFRILDCFPAIWH